MATSADLLIRNARVVDPARGHDAVGDVAVAGDQIAAVGAGLDAARTTRVIDGTGHWLLPGIVDSHVHMRNLKGVGNRSTAHERLAVAGVTTAVEFAHFRRMLDQWPASAAGLTVLGIEALPAYAEHTPRHRIAADIAAVVRDGAIGVKILGGHFPSTPDASAAIIAEANTRRCYVAFHAGTTVHGSNLEGMAEALSLADGQRLHLAHTNAYLRGANLELLDENRAGLELLLQHPQVVSESHLAPLNMCFGGVAGGRLTDHIAINCLRLRGYDTDLSGLEHAFADGYAYLHRPEEAEPITGAAALESWQTLDEPMLSFPVNMRLTGYHQVVARNQNGQVGYDGQGDFVVDAIASDGGEWRNLILDQGLLLVQFGSLSLLEFAAKTSLVPASFFGLTTKGRISEGADADLALIDPVTRRPAYTIAMGSVIAEHGRPTGQGGRILTTSEGASALEERGLPYRVIDLEGSLFMTKGNRAPSGIQAG